MRASIIRSGVVALGVLGLACKGASTERQPRYVPNAELRKKLREAQFDDSNGGEARAVDFLRENETARREAEALIRNCRGGVCTLEEQNTAIAAITALVAASPAAVSVARDVVEDPAHSGRLKMTAGLLMAHAQRDAALDALLSSLESHPEHWKFLFSGIATAASYAEGPDIRMVRAVAVYKTLLRNEQSPKERIELERELGELERMSPRP